ncbi:MAG: ABC transporter substrate-binding protein [Burkholderiales bacterium]|nr:ABC transporter substrate-binding protein [Burkholderiales bacterium]
MRMKGMMYAVLGLCCSAALAAKPLVICGEDDPESFDPGASNWVATYDAAGSKIYNNLIEVAPGPFKLEPALATRWDVSADGLVYTFSLRHGVKWQTRPWFKPTREFNADDVLWTLQRQLDPKHPGAKAAPTGFPYAASGDWPHLIKSVDKVDDYTVRITLYRPYAPMLSEFTIAGLGVVSAEYGQYLDKIGKPTQMGSEPIGTGPYQLTRYDKSAQIRYEANPDYWRTKVGIDKLVIALVRDPAVRNQKLLAGECQLATINGPQDVSVLEHDPHLTSRPSMISATRLLFFNVKKPPLDDKRVRQALALAIDRRVIARTSYGNRAEPATGNYYSGRTLWGVDGGKPLEPDLARARALLAEAGHADGFESEIVVASSGADKSLEQIAQLIQSDVARIGVKLKIVALEWGEFSKRARLGELPISTSTWMNFVDPDSVYVNLVSCGAVSTGSNRSMYCNPKVDNLIDAARTVQSQAQRTQHYLELEKLLRDDMPMTPVVYPITTVFFDKRLQNVLPSAIQTYRAEDLRWN